MKSIKSGKKLPCKILVLLLMCFVMVFSDVQIGNMSTVHEVQAASAKTKRKARTKLEEYYRSISGCQWKRAYYYDLTHDGVTELIVVASKLYYNSYTSCPEYSVKVYTYKNDRVREIYSRRGTDFHAGGFISVHLYKKSGKYYLVHTDGTLWQGYGTLGYEVFYLSSSGKRRYLKREYVSGSPVSEKKYRTVAKHYKKYIEYKTLISTYDDLV